MWHWRWGGGGGRGGSVASVPLDGPQRQYDTLRPAAEAREARHVGLACFQGSESLRLAVLHIEGDEGKVSKGAGVGSSRSRTSASDRGVGVQEVRELFQVIETQHVPVFLHNGRGDLVWMMLQLQLANPSPPRLPARFANFCDLVKKRFPGGIYDVKLVARKSVLRGASTQVPRGGGLQALCRLLEAFGSPDVSFCWPSGGPPLEPAERDAALTGLCAQALQNAPGIQLEDYIGEMSSGETSNRSWFVWGRREGGVHLTGKKRRRESSQGVSPPEGGGSASSCTIM